MTYEELVLCWGETLEEGMHDESKRNQQDGHNHDDTKDRNGLRIRHVLNEQRATDQHNHQRKADRCIQHIAQISPPRSEVIDKEGIGAKDHTRKEQLCRWRVPADHRDCAHKKTSTIRMRLVCLQLEAS